MKKLFVNFLFGIGVMLFTVNQPLGAHCYSCDGGANDGYCKGEQVKACVDTGNWWDSRCDLDPKCASLDPG